MELTYVFGKAGTTAGFAYGDLGSHEGSMTVTERCGGWVNWPKAPKISDDMGWDAGGSTGGEPTLTGGGGTGAEAEGSGAGVEGTGTGTSET